MDPELRSALLAQFMMTQENRKRSVGHLIKSGDEFLDSGSARVENYPGRRRPLHPEEDFMGFIAVTKRLFIYKDDFGEIVLPFRDIKKLKCEAFPLAGTSGLSLELDQMYTYFSAQELFARDLGKAFKSGAWKDERKLNPKSRNIMLRVFSKN
jgi:hypothetical protein